MRPALPHRRVPPNQASNERLHLATHALRRIRWALAVLAVVAASACAAPAQTEERGSSAERISFGGEVAEVIGQYLTKFFSTEGVISVWDNIVASWHGFESLVTLFTDSSQRAAVKELALLDAKGAT